MKPSRSPNTQTAPTFDSGKPSHRSIAQAQRSRSADMACGMEAPNQQKVRIDFSEIILA
ncbi:MAG TPA: hypothetical protein VK814_18790 [Acidobacteriaceae bacterium]|jgi:hypothetical protein|nr:hypothetical protein [Acidobacteriaceae bacterium]